MIIAMKTNTANTARIGRLEMNHTRKSTEDIFNVLKLRLRPFWMRTGMVSGSVETGMGVDVECGLSLPAWQTIPFVFPHPSHKHLVFMRKEPGQSECHDNLNFCHTSC